MRAAIISERFGTPMVQDVAEPDAEDSTVKIRVQAAGLQPTDLLRANGLYKTPEVPYIIGGEGVGIGPDGKRVYFGHSIARSGAFAEWTIVPTQEVWPLPDDIDDGQAIALAIAGTGALIPMQEAEIRPGENVLILGATGPVGQVAAQLARVLGAGRIVGAARKREPLLRLQRLGIIDEVVQLGSEDDASALTEVAREGFDVVFDGVFGPPLKDALRASRFGARIICVGAVGGLEVTLSRWDIARRTIKAVGTGYRPAAERKAAWEYLLSLSREGRMAVECVWFDLESAPEAWASLITSPGGKVIARVAS